MVSLRSEIESTMIPLADRCTGQALGMKVAHSAQWALLACRDFVLVLGEKIDTKGANLQIFRQSPLQNLEKGIGTRCAVLDAAASINYTSLLAPDNKVPYSRCDRCDRHFM